MYAFGKSLSFYKYIQEKLTIKSKALTAYILYVYSIHFFTIVSGTIDHKKLLQLFNSITKCTII